MILFPASQFEITTPLTVLEAENALREHIVTKKMKGYRGKVNASGFRLGCSRYLKIPVSELCGQVKKHESGSILSGVIRPTYVQFIFPLIFVALAFSRITIDFSQFLQIMMISIIIFGLLVVLYQYSIKKDRAFIESIFLK